MISNKKFKGVFQQKLARQKNINLAYIFIIVVMAALVVVYYNSKRKQQKINTILAQKNNEILLQEEALSKQATKLNDLNSLKDRLIAILAHDLRAPISTLRGLFNLMIDNSLSHEEFIEMIPQVFKQLEHTSDFLDTLLFWINSEVAGNENTNNHFNVDELVNRELLYLENQLKQKNISVNVKIETDTIMLADPNSIRIVIHNFLTNAIKFSNRDGIIEISAYKDAHEQVIFSVKDHGVGMSIDYLDNLFKSRVASCAGTENEIGTGMGLLFCKDLIEKNKGTIWAKSVLGEGTELGFGVRGG